jgi:hypothetical protein
MSLILVGCVDLLNRVECFGFEVKALPYFGETSPTQLFSSKISLYECPILEYGLIMCSFEDGFFLVE